MDDCLVLLVIRSGTPSPLSWAGGGDISPSVSESVADRLSTAGKGGGVVLGGAPAGMSRLGSGVVPGTPVPPPICRGPSLYRGALAPIFAFLKRTEVRRPTPTAGRGGAKRPLPAPPSLHRQATCPSSSDLAPLSPSAADFRCLWGRPLGLESATGCNVGGSWGASPCWGGSVAPVGSSIGGSTSFISSGCTKKSNFHFIKGRREKHQRSGFIEQ